MGSPENVICEFFWGVSQKIFTICYFNVQFQFCVIMIIVDYYV